MNDIIVKPVTMDDITAWISLAHEYDDYVKELIHDLTHWYEGNESDIAFSEYMEIKIKQDEAFMAIEKNTKKRLGIVGFSRRHNRITFFGVSQNADFILIGQNLIRCALSHLNNNLEITINILKSKAQYVEKQRKLFKKHGFICIEVN